MNPYKKENRKNYFWFNVQCVSDGICQPAFVHKEWVENHKEARKYLAKNLNKYWEVVS